MHIMVSISFILDNDWVKYIEDDDDIKSLSKDQMLLLLQYQAPSKKSYFDSTQTGTKLLQDNRIWINVQSSLVAQQEAKNT